MRKSELTQFKQLVQAEISRRKQINQYLACKEVLECLRLMGANTDKKDLEDIRDMLKDILKNFHVSSTNGIYVCTKSFDRDSQAPLTYYFKPEGNSDYKCYKDIESQEEVETDWIYGPSIQDFERSHIVLNPYNASFKDKEIQENGYEDVRLDFFEDCFRHGQNHAIQKVIQKYPRIGSFYSR